MLAPALHSYDEQEPATVSAMHGCLHQPLCRTAGKEASRNDRMPPVGCSAAEDTVMKGPFWQPLT